jgi:hypothetical protein
LQVKSARPFAQSRPLDKSGSHAFSKRSSSDPEFVNFG